MFFFSAMDSALDSCFWLLLLAVAESGWMTPVLCHNKNRASFERHKHVSFNSDATRGHRWKCDVVAQLINTPSKASNFLLHQSEMIFSCWGVQLLWDIWDTFSHLFFRHFYRSGAHFVDMSIPFRLHWIDCDWSSNQWQRFNGDTIDRSNHPIINTTAAVFSYFDFIDQAHKYTASKHTIDWIRLSQLKRTCTIPFSSITVENNQYDSISSIHRSTNLSSRQTDTFLRGTATDCSVPNACHQVYSPQ